MDLPTVKGGCGPRFLRHRGTAAVLEDSQALGSSHGSLDRVGEGVSLLLTTGDLDAGDAPAVALAKLVSRGIRALIAPGYERELYQRSFAEGLLPAIVSIAAIERLVAHLAARPESEITVDLEKQVIECDDATIPFEVDPRGRNKLLLGLSDVDEITRHAARTVALRAADRERRPWLYRRS